MSNNNLPLLTCYRVNSRWVSELTNGFCLDYSQVREQIEEELCKKLLSSIDILYSDNMLHELTIRYTEFLDLRGIVYNPSVLKLDNNYFMESLYGLSDNNTIRTLKINDCDKLSLNNIHKYHFDNLNELNLDKGYPNMLGIFVLPSLNVLGIRKTDNPDLSSIFQNHFLNDKDMLECQEELISKGFKEYAKL